MRDQVEEVKNKTDIVSLIGEQVKLTKAGKHFKGLCPFHSEKTSSFIVSPELQIFKCFGCGESGDVFTFLEKYEGMDFYESLKYLAERAGVKLRDFSPGGERSPKDFLYSLNALAAKFYQFLLLNHSVGKEALKYLKEKRGLSVENIKEFGLGYAPPESNTLINFLTKKKNYKISDLVMAGLVIEGKNVDRFRGRITFPIFDHRGNNIGFSARVLPGPMENKMAKYVNSPETPVYHKSSTLFGLNFSRGFIKKSAQVVMVEGNMDMISLFTAGIKNVVAINGTSLTSDQIMLISRFADEVILALDADLAGSEAAKRGITIAQNAGLTVKVLRQTAYKDPDEFVRSDPKGFKDALKNAIGVWDFIIDSTIAKYGGKSGESKAKISRELVPMLRSINDSIVLDHYISLVARKLGVSPEAVASEVGKSSTDTTKVQAKKEDEDILSRESLLEEEVFSLALAFDPAVLLTDEYKSAITSSFGSRILENLEKYLLGGKEYSHTNFLDSLDEELKVKYTQLVLNSQSEEFSKSKSEELLKKTYFELKNLQIRKKLEKLAKKIEKYEKTKQRKALKEAQREFSKLSNKLKLAS